MFEKIFRPCVLNCRDYIPGKPVEEVERELGLINILKMASNENPLGTSPKAIEAMIREIHGKSCRYPESLCVDLVAKVAELQNVEQSQVVIGNGLDNIITLLGMTFINLDDEIIFGDLSFPAYGNITRKMGGVCVEVPMTKEEALDLDEFVKAITPKTKMVFVCNPNNPTGTINTREEVEGFLKKVPSNVIVVFDEAYFDFAESAQYPSMIPYINKYNNIIVLRTFSKIMGLAALRIGYSVSVQEIAKAIQKVREPFPVNRIAQAGALAALDDSEFIEKTIRINYDGRMQYYEAFTHLGLDYIPSQANFVYVKISKPAAAVFETMLHDGVIIRPLGSQNRPNSLRISVGTKEDNVRTIKSLEIALNHK